MGFWRKSRRNAGLPIGRCCHTIIVMAADSFIQCRVSAATKEALRAAAERQQLSESALVKRMIDLMLYTAAPPAVTAVPSDSQPTRLARLYVRLSSGDWMLLRERAAARCVAPATYASNLIRAHVRAVSPLLKEELDALRRAVAVLRTIGNNLNQIARMSHQNGHAIGPNREDLRSMLKICEGPVAPALKESSHLQGRGSVKELVEDWDLELDAEEAKSAYSGRPGRKPVKLVHNIVLSMPAGTPAKGVLAASRAFAREQFVLKNRYAMVLHTDQPHPHVHLVVKAMGEQGERLNIRKATLREWRLEFARHLREQGIDANATQRAVRGENKTTKRDGIYHAMLRGESSHMRNRAERVARELFAGEWRIDLGTVTLLKTRKEIDRGWRAVSEILERQGEFELADGVRRFSSNMRAAMTDREQMAANLIERAHDTRLNPAKNSKPPPAHAGPGPVTSTQKQRKVEETRARWMTIDKAR